MIKGCGKVCGFTGKPNFNGNRRNEFKVWKCGETTDFGELVICIDCQRNVKW